MNAHKNVNRAYLSLGSNIEPEKNLPLAVKKLGSYGRIRRASNVYETAPVGTVDQPRFLNAAVILETILGAHDIQTFVIGKIESDLKRVRTDDKNGPRTIDVDLSIFNQTVVDRDVEKSVHVVVPLSELEPGFKLPSGILLQECVEALGGKGGMKLRLDVKLEVDSA